MNKENMRSSSPDKQRDYSEGESLETNTFISWASIMIIIGFLLIFFSSLSDILGFGTAPKEFGNLQMVGCITRVILLINGITVAVFKKFLP